MTNIKLVNKDGKIFSIDPETDEEVPIELGSGLGSDENPVPDESYFESVSTDELNTTKSPKTGPEIKAAIEDSDDGTKVEIPRGTFEVDNPVTVSGSHIEIEGAGRRGTTLLKQNDDQLLRVEESSCAVRNLTLDSEIDDNKDGLYTPA